jgi:hypothetical protein
MNREHAVCLPQPPELRELRIAPDATRKTPNALAFTKDRERPAVIAECAPSDSVAELAQAVLARLRHELLSTDALKSLLPRADLV